MKTIITIQHTQSIHHTNGMVGSWTDWELSEKGLQQAEKIGSRLKDRTGVFVRPDARKTNCRNNWQAPGSRPCPQKRIAGAQPRKMLRKICPMAP